MSVPQSSPVVAPPLLDLVAGEAVVLDPSFAAINPPLCASELAELEARLRRDGFLIPLVVWQGENRLLDGYNRYALFRRLGMAFGATAVALPDRAAAVTWIIAHQMGRRNLTRQGHSYLRGLRYRQAKGAHGGRARRRGRVVKMATCTGQVVNRATCKGQVVKMAT